MAQKDSGEFKKEQAAFHEALTIYQQLNDKAQTAKILNNLGISCKNSGDTDKSIDYLQQSLKLYTELHTENHDLVAKALSNLGLAYKKKGDLEKALEYLEKSLAIFKILYPGNNKNVAMLLRNLGMFTHIYRIALIYIPKIIELFSIYLIGLFHFYTTLKLLLKNDV